MIASFDLPLEPVPARNSREHWRAVAKRGKAEKGAVLLVFKTFRELPQLIEAAKRGATVTITRFYGKRCRAFDGDNMMDAAKSTRDQVARCLQSSDAPNSPLRWGYKQRPVPIPGQQAFVRIEVETHNPQFTLMTVEAAPMTDAQQQEMDDYVETK
jgi:hypothetical protein